MVFEEWKALHDHNFRISSSDLLSGENGAIFKYVVYHCVYYGEPRIKAVPLRQSRFSMGEGLYDEIYQIQYEKILRLKKDREEMIKNYHKQLKEAVLKKVGFDPPLINKDTLSFYKKALDRGAPFDDQQHKELAELTKKLLEKKMKSMQFE